MRESAKLLAIIVCAAALAVSCVSERQPPDAPETVSEDKIMSISELERLYAAHEAQVNEELARGFSHIFPDYDRVHRLAAQVPYHKRFFAQKVSENSLPAFFVLRESALLWAVQQEIIQSGRLATTEVAREAWLRVLEED